MNTTGREGDLSLRHPPGQSALREARRQDLSHSQAAVCTPGRSLAARCGGGATRYCQARAPSTSCLVQAGGLQSGRYTPGNTASTRTGLHQVCHLQKRDLQLHWDGDVVRILHSVTNWRCARKLLL